MLFSAVVFLGSCPPRFCGPIYLFNFNKLRTLMLELWSTGSSFCILFQRSVPLPLLYDPHAERDAHRYLVLELESPDYLLIGKSVPVYLLLYHFLPRYI